MNQARVITRPYGTTVETNKVLRNTYMLLSLTLLFSAVVAGVSMTMDLPRWTGLACSIGAMLLMFFVLPRTANSAAGIGVVFAITGLLGIGLGPLLSMYMGLPNGSQHVTLALGGTAVIFLGLSGYALVTKRDFSFLGGMLMVGFLVVLVAAIVNIFLAIPAVTLAISAAIIMIMSGFILFDTSRIINGGETNYVMATVSLYLSIYNIFVSLLQILGIMGSDE